MPNKIKAENMKRIIIIAGVLAMTGMGAGAALAQSDFLTDDKGVAIGGYDVVAYASQNDAVRGTSKHASTVSGATFYFSSSDNKAQFDSEPAKYLPAYGGHCAFAMAVGNGKVASDPRTFKMYDGTLYLFYNDYYEGAPFNTIVPWNGDEANNKKQADANWAAIK